MIYKVFGSNILTKIEILKLTKDGKWKERRKRDISLAGGSEDTEIESAGFVDEVFHEMSNDWTGKKSRRLYWKE